jgi:hypothetical protein
LPVLVRGPASQPTPSQYQLAAGEGFTPESVTATFDGSGAAAAFLACLSIYAQSGELLGRTFPEEVAAGDIAKVTFAPLLRAAPAAAPAGVTLVPFANWASTLTVDNVPAGGASSTHLDGSYMETNATDVFEMGQSVEASLHNVLLIKQPGIYTTWAFASFGVNGIHADEPAASLMWCQWDSFNYPASELDTFNLTAKAVSGHQVSILGGRNTWHPWDTDSISNDGTLGPPFMEYVPALYNAGAQPQTVRANLLCIRWSEVNATYL